MARTEDGEFELILGNRQLLSVFFIVVVLLGVFFSMGYLVGRNSVGPENYAGRRDPIVVDSTNPTPRDPNARIVDPRADSGKPSAFDPVKPAVGEPKPVPVDTATPPREDTARKEREAEANRRAQETRDLEVRRQAENEREARKKLEAKKHEDQKQRDQKQHDQKQQDRARKETKETKETADVRPATGPVPSLTADGSPAPGQQFLQVVASTRPDCEFIAGMLKRRGFVATVVPGPDAKLFRVVVGPLPDPATIAKTRGELEKAGFQNPMVRKY